MRLTKEESYKIMFIFLEELYIQTRSDIIGGLLGGFSILTDGSTADPAVWEDFTQIFHEETTKEKVSINKVSGIIKKFLIFYKDEFGYDLDNAIQEFHKLSSNKENFKKYIESIINNSENDEKMVLHLFRNE